MHLRKGLIVLLAFIMVILSACGGQQKSQASNEKNLNKTGFPIVKKPIKLNFFTGKAPDNSNKFEDTLVWKTYAKKTNINVKFNLIPFEGLDEKRNLTLASNNLPDVFYSARIPAEDLLKYGKQGTIIKLDDLINKYAPNIKKLLSKYPDLKKGLTMADGHIYSLPSFYDPNFLSMLVGKPLWVNQVWLKKLGMKEPQTIDDYYKYLVAVKKTDLNGNGKHDEIPYSSAGINEAIDQLKGAWGFGNRGLGHKFVDEDPQTGKLRFFRIDSKYKEVLQFLNKLYKERLMDQNIFTQLDPAVIAKGADGLLGSATIPNPMAQFNSKDYVGLSALKGPHGDQVYSHIKTPLVWPGAFAVTSANKHPEATIRWIDYLFSDEGAQFYFMGVKGKSYEESSDGQAHYTSDITNNSHGLSQDQALTKYVTWIGGSYPGYVQEKYFKGSESLPNSIAVQNKIKKQYNYKIWNAFNYTEEETQFRQTQGLDLENYINEMEAKFIAGSASFDQWDAYVKKVKQMGLSQYMKIENAAYKRYMKQ
ncbi:MAG: extracellular solute-binding protein [Sporolactobacillus sp.]|jgi:putative aldouronate transport system substrate-binding protein|nr:extracellular solute-binding protein [Sporolactobacillus sp.]